MPETGFHEIRGLTKEVKQSSLTEGRFLYEDEVEELVKKFDQDYVGSGAECVVVDVPQKRIVTRQGKNNETEIVVATTYEKLSPTEAKKIFYTQRILEILFPHNFPHFFAVAGAVEGKEDNSGSVREKVGASYAYDKHQPKYPFSIVTEGINDMNLPVRLDSTAINYMVGLDGGVYYLDRPRTDDRKWNEEVVVSYMRSHGYNQKEVRIVQKSIGRLKGLANQ